MAQTQVQVKRDQMPAKKMIITGTAVVAEMASGGLFLENVKMEKQRTSLPYPTLMRQILSQGIKGFEAGLVPWGLILGFTKGAVLGASHAELVYRCKQLHLSKKSTEIVSGFGSGAIQGLFMSPLLLARTRVNQALTERVASGKVTTSLAQEIKLSSLVLTDIIKNEGVLALTQGMGTMVVKRAMDWGTRFVFINLIRSSILENKAEGEKLSDIDKLGSSFVGGALSVSITMPVDRLMPVLQAANTDKSNIIRYMREKVAKEGLTTLFRGWAMRTFHTGYHTTFAIFVADKIYELLN